jgi:LmbE family N-acetylglucosaminyl deacetylase
MMAGTLLQLGGAGYELHMLNIANGSLGTAVLDREAIIATRTAEARQSAAVLGAVFHPPLVDDLEVVYDTRLVARLCAIVREVRPEILLLPSPQDYMEDHMNAARLMVSAAFTRGMRNYPGDPTTAPVQHDMALYHALPYGLRDQLRRPIRPDFYIDIAPVLERKSQALACHASQRDWLDRSQGAGSYVAAMTGMAAEVGRWSGRFTHAEGWRRHAHLGFGPEDFNPLAQALAAHLVPNEEETPQ